MIFVNIIRTMCNILLVDVITIMSQPYAISGYS